MESVTYQTVGQQVQELIAGGMGRQEAAERVMGDLGAPKRFWPFMVWAARHAESCVQRSGDAVTVDIRTNTVSRVSQMIKKVDTWDRMITIQDGIRKPLRMITRKDLLWKANVLEKRAKTTMQTVTGLKKLADKVPEDGVLPDVAEQLTERDWEVLKMPEDERQVFVA